MSQIELCRDLDFAQSRMSKFESARLTPSAVEWITISRYFKFAPTTILNGTIPGNTPIKIKNISDVGSYKLPVRYSEMAGSSSRSLKPFIDTLIESSSREGFEGFCKKRRLDPDYFVHDDNQVSVKVAADITTELFDRNRLTPDTFHRIGKKYSPGLETETVAETIKGIILNVGYREDNSTYQLEDLGNEGLELSTRVKSHLEDYKVLKGGALICRFKTAALLAAISRCRDSDQYKIKKLSCYHSGAERCVYRFQKN